MDKIIFITPYFGNTGSDVALLNLMVRINGRKVVVVSKHRGSLANRLPSHIEFHDYKSFCRRNRWSVRWFELKSKVTRSRRSAFDYFLDTILKKNKATICVNTLTLPEVVHYLNKRHYQYVLHSHELQHMLAGFRKQDIVAMIEGPAFIFTSSQVSGRVLQTLGRDRNMVHNYPGIDVEKIKVKRTPSEVRESLKIGRGSFLIAMSGTVDSNKNPEGFLEIGKILKEKGHAVHLMWIGVNNDNGYAYFLRRKSKQYGLEMACSWIPKLEGDEYYEHLNSCDCFVLTSRQESFSIVVVEALALGKPVFSFRSGGPEEILDHESIGVFAEGHSSYRMAEAIEKLISGSVSFDASRARQRALEFSATRSFELWQQKLLEQKML